MGQSLLQGEEERKVDGEGDGGLVNNESQLLRVNFNRQRNPKQIRKRENS